MVAEAGNDDVFLLTSLENRHFGVHKGGFVIDEDFDFLLRGVCAESFVGDSAESFHVSQ